VGLFGEDAEKAGRTDVDGTAMMVRPFGFNQLADRRSGADRAPAWTQTARIRPTQPLGDSQPFSQGS